MVVKGVPYENPEGYLFLDQKRKLGLVKRIRKQIDKFGLTNQDLGLEISQIRRFLCTLVRTLKNATRHTFAAHLQGPQSDTTNPSLQKSYNFLTLYFLRQYLTHTDPGPVYFLKQKPIDILPTPLGS